MPNRPHLKPGYFEDLKQDANNDIGDIGPKGNFKMGSGEKTLKNNRRGAMYEIKLDTDKNRLYLTFGKIEDEAEMQEIVQNIKSKCKKLKKGFTCLTDLRKYDPVNGMFEKYIKEAQQALIESGMSSVVRVRSPMGSMAHFQFDNVSYEVGYHAPNVTSIEEGERLLDEKT